MRLRRQLLLVSCLFLSLPIVGILFFRELEAALRQGQEQALSATARAIADRIRSAPVLVGQVASGNAALAQGVPFYVERRDIGVVLDGYDDEWQQIVEPGQSFNGPDQQWQSRWVLSQGRLYAFIKVTQAAYQFHRPNVLYPASGDFALLSAGDDRIILRTGAAGAMQTISRQGGRIGQDHRVKAFWQQTNDGYQIELQLPGSWLEQPLGFGVFNAQLDQWHSNLGTISRPDLRLIDAFLNDAPIPLTGLPTLAEQINPFVHAGVRVRVLNKGQWLLAEVDNLADQTIEPPPLAYLYRWLFSKVPVNALDDNTYGLISSNEVSSVLHQGSMAHGWYRYNPSFNLLHVAVPVAVDGDIQALVIADETSAQWLTLSDATFKRWLLYSVLSLVFAAGFLFLYATWLSWRIVRLGNAVSKSALQDGKISRRFPRSNFPDELGDLNRSYADLLDRIGEYNRYLQSLAGKLSHELRTPMAIVKSSLDNLAHSELTDHQKTYVQRANQGTERLSSILTAMNSSQRLEESIGNTELERVDLCELIEHLAIAYRQLLPETGIKLEAVWPEQPVELLCAPDLLVQMLDKLFDNAKDFCTQPGTIELRLHQDARAVLIAVANTGPQLPSNMASELFNSLVSVREQDSANQSGTENLHLGLGLYIVKLIVDFHRGNVSAQNTDTGVEFLVTLPIVSS
jgi:dedicated sortase system histidine kinase